MTRKLLMFFSMCLLSLSIASSIQGNGGLTGDDIAAQARGLIVRYGQGDLDVYRRLKITSDDRLVPVFLEALNHSSSKIKILAVGLLTEYRKKEAIGPITELLKHDENADVRAASAVSLGRLGAVESSIGLLNAVNDKSPRVVRVAVRALGRLKCKEAIDPLQKKLFHCNQRYWLLRLATIDALHDITGKYPPQGIRYISAETQIRNKDITLQDYEMAMENLGSALGRIDHAGSIEELSADEAFFRNYSKTVIVLEGYYLKQNAQIRKKTLENTLLAQKLGEMTDDDVTKAKESYNQAQKKYNDFLVTNTWSE